MSQPKRMTFTSREVGGGHTSKTEWVSLEDYELLKAEVERLRKAGDAMEIALQADFNGCPYEPLVIMQAIRRWRTAKEGKQP